MDALVKAIREGATSPPGGELIWWPLILLLVGLAAFIASFGSAGATIAGLRGGSGTQVSLTLKKLPVLVTPLTVAVSPLWASWTALQ